MKLIELAERLSCRLEGDGDVEILRVAGLHDAQPGDVTFLANARYAPELQSTRASAVIVSLDAALPAGSYALLRTRDPYSAFARAVALLLHVEPPPKGISSHAAIAADVSLGDDVAIGPFVTIGAGASIGARTWIYPNVVIGAGTRLGEDCIVHSHVSVRDGVSIGNRVILHDGVVVGSDGFGFARQADGTHLKIPQHAPVVIEDDVEIGANCTIDRPAVGETRIRAGTKIDNLVHIAHGVTVGRRVVMAAQSGIAGSTTVEDDVMIAGQSGVTGHVRVGAGVKIGAKSAVLNSVEPGAFVTGHPAFDHPNWRRAAIVFRQLPSLKKRIHDLEQRATDFEEKLAAWRIPPDR